MNIFFVARNNIFIIIALTIAVVACRPKQNNSEQTVTPVQQPSQLNDINMDTLSTSTNNQQVTTQRDAEVMLNPPHGEPNHRCDIPVGSPLNAPANNSAAITTQNASSNQPSSGQRDSEVMLNPPHGEPNHRCDIPVGSPLNAASNNTPTTTNTESTEQTKRNPADNPFAPTVENAERLKSSQTYQQAAPRSEEKPSNNPPHGEPWHRCDIAVGSPLP